MNSWQEKNLGDFLTQKKRKVIINPNAEYSLVTISNKGIVRLREKKRGAEIAAKKAYLAKAGDFIYSRLTAHTGAFGIVGEELNNALVTGEMPCFEIDKRQALPDVLTNMLKMPEITWQLKRFTQGMGKVRIKENTMLSLSLLLPDISEQKKLSRKTQAFKHKLAQLDVEFSNQQKLLAGLQLRMLRDAVNEKLMANLRKVQIGTFLFERTGRHNPRSDNVRNLSRVEKIGFSGEFHISEKSSNTDMILIKPGDFVISGINAAKGAVGVYEGSSDIVATIHYSSYTFDENVVDIGFFKHFVKSAEFTRLLKEQVKGGIKTEIKAKHLLPIAVNLPPLSDQKRIAKLLALCDSLQAEARNNEALAKRLMQAALKEAFTPPKN